MWNKFKIGCGLGIIGVMLTGCMTPEQQAAEAALVEKAKKVRIISASKAEGCDFIAQSYVVETLNALTGQQGMENDARWKLMRWAAKRDANALHISDGMLDKGRGGYDQTRLTLYGDIYSCPDLSTGAAS